jgi:hypothetical protein
MMLNIYHHHHISTITISVSYFTTIIITVIIKTVLPVKVSNAPEMFFNNHQPLLIDITT